MTVIDELAASIARQRNAEILAHKKLFAEKVPNVLKPADLVIGAEYPIQSFRFDYWAFFYIRLECYITYESGEKMQFHGEGGGVGAGGGIYAGGSGSPFFLPPSQLPGDSSFYFQPAAIGALLHFWRGGTNIGTLVGAGAGTGISFGGAGTWSTGP